MKILVAINGSSQAEQILRFAMQIALHSGEPPAILIVTDHNKGCRVPQSDKVLNLALELLVNQDITTKIRTGDSVKEIMQEAIEGGYDLLIIGEVHASFLPHIFRGFDPAQIAEDTPCPVIFVKNIIRPIHRILLCDSGGGRSSVLNRFVLQLVDILEGEEEITILHVMSQISAGPSVSGHHLRATFEELIEEQSPEGQFIDRDIQQLKKPGVRPTPKILHGLVVDEILNEARRGDYDLVVIGQHQDKTWQHFLLEDLAHKILIQSDRPVLVVK